jgi:hypothetical protein
VAPPQMQAQTAKTAKATIASLLQMAARAKKFTVRREIRQTLYWECNHLRDSTVHYWVRLFIGGGDRLFRYQRQDRCINGDHTIEKHVRWVSACV